MTRLVSLTLLLFAFAVPVHAQTVATPSNHLAWTEAGQTVAQATGAVYNSYVDAAAAVPVAGVTCVAGVPATDAACTSQLPVLTLGQHTLTITQVISGAESPKSNGVTFTFVVVQQPSALRIAKLLTFFHGGVLSSRGRQALRRVQVRPVR